MASLPAVAVASASNTNLEIHLELHEANWSLHWNSTVLSSLLNDPSTHDVTFKTSDGGTVSAHKTIVAASSSVFYDMLYRDSSTTGSPYVLQNGVDAVTFSKLITFIYTGKVTVNSTCLDKMLSAACHFKVRSFETTLIKSAENSLNVNNVIAITIISSNQNCDQLQKCCQKFICANINKVVHCFDFVELPLNVILEVCKSSDLNISEIDLFLAVVRWHSHQKVFKKPTSKKIFQQIRYPLISSDDLMHKVKPTKLADTNLYTGALEYHIKPSGYSGPRTQLVNRKYQPLTSANVSASSTEPYNWQSGGTPMRKKYKFKKPQLVKRSRSFSQPAAVTMTPNASTTINQPVSQPSAVIRKEVTRSVVVSLPVYLSTTASSSGTNVVTTSTAGTTSTRVITTISAPNSITTPDVVMVDQQSTTSASRSSVPTPHSITLPVYPNVVFVDQLRTASLPRKRAHRKRCGSCSGCKADKCNSCINCTQPNRNKVCMKRICLDLK
ncbi:kelch-like protein 12 isoform X2 [Dysidea avara]|uniref:kelch-like protein 12 isoform X2 n=1 Tax=Dysidea avara TaxID=196820 RepID=UPI00332D19C4